MEKTIKEIAYQKYQLDWMMKHGYGIEDLIASIDDMQVDNFDNGIASVANAYPEWEQDFGFNGSLWVCFNEFLGAEYLCGPYMEELLNDKEFDLWIEDIERGEGK